MQNTLCVGNLPSAANPAAVEKLLSTCGKVLNVKVMAHADIFRRHGGFAVVQMETEDDATKAIRTLDGSKFHGNTITVHAETALEATAAGRPRMFSTMNMAEDPEPPTSA